MTDPNDPLDEVEWTSALIDEPNLLETLKQKALDKLEEERAGLRDKIEDEVDSQVDKAREKVKTKTDAKLSELKDKAKEKLSGRRPGDPDDAEPDQPVEAVGQAAPPSAVAAASAPLTVELPSGGTVSWPPSEPKPEQTADEDTDQLPASHVQDHAATVSIEVGSAEPKPDRASGNANKLFAVGAVLVALIVGGVFLLSGLNDDPVVVAADDSVTSTAVPTTEPAETPEVTLPIAEPTALPVPATPSACAAGEVEGATGRCERIVRVDCSIDRDPQDLRTGEVMELSAWVVPTGTAIDYMFDHGDGTRVAANPQLVLFREARRYVITVEWQAGDQRGTETCANAVVAPIPRGWQACSANFPDPKLRYRVVDDNRVDDQGLSVRERPGVEALRTDVWLRGTTGLRFIDCLEDASGNQWWKHEDGGWSSAQFLSPV